MTACLDRWHEFLSDGADSPELLGEIIHPESVFLSPIVFTPQRGRDLVMGYLLAAGQTLAGTDEQPFRYVKEVVDSNQAVLEFETSIGGKYVNGVDIITCDVEGLITEFKVMVRPLQAVNLVHEQMMAMLAAMKPSS